MTDDKVVQPEDVPQLGGQEADQANDLPQDSPTIQPTTTCFMDHYLPLFAGTAYVDELRPWQPFLRFDKHHALVVYMSEKDDLLKVTKQIAPDIHTVLQKTNLLEGIKFPFPFHKEMPTSFKRLGYSELPGQKSLVAIHNQSKHIIHIPSLYALSAYIEKGDELRAFLEFDPPSMDITPFHYTDDDDYVFNEDYKLDPTTIARFVDKGHDIDLMKIIEECEHVMSAIKNILRDNVSNNARKEKIKSYLAGRIASYNPELYYGKK